MSDSKRVESATQAVSITVNSVVNVCRGVYIGVADSYDFTLDGTTWVQFSNCAAGSIIPLAASGARHATGDTAPDAGDIVFLY